MQPQNPPPQVAQLNWSYFKPEFSGKPEEDAVAHLLRTNDWMETHNFPDDTKVQRFCLENVETVDAYVNRITQIAALLGYGKPQTLEVFKNTVTSRLYWILYAIHELRVAVETAKRVLTKERIDKQRTGQSSTCPFMKASQENK